MFGRVKNYLGIEGVKVELEIPEQAPLSLEQVSGKVRFISMNTQTVTEIKVKMTERYIRGRGKDRKIDEYELGTISMKKNIEITPEQPVEIEFVLPFTITRSEVDDFSSKNIIFKSLAKVATLAYAAQSEYYVVAEAKVKGNALPPFSKQQIDLK